MTRLSIVSDLHFEFYDDNGATIARKVGDRARAEGADLLIVAGDLCGNPKMIYESLEKLIKWCPVPIVYVTGNHEHYHGSIEEVHEVVKTLPPGVTCLDNDFVDFPKLGGIRLVGGTGWFPYEPENLNYEHLMTDFRVIKDIRRYHNSENEKFGRTIARHCREGDIVISHHLPIHDSVSARFTSSALNRFFVGEFEYELRIEKPKLWIHGHTHDRCDYRFRDTRVVCNPLGYPSERASTNPYDYGMIVDV